MSRDDLKYIERSIDYLQILALFYIREHLRILVSVEVLAFNPLSIPRDDCM